MKLKAGKNALPFGPGLLEGAHLFADGIRYVLCEIRHVDWKAFDKEVRGLPRRLRLPAEH